MPATASPAASFHDPDGPSRSYGMQRFLAALSLTCLVGPGLVISAQDSPTPKFVFDVASIRQNTDPGGRNHIYNDKHTGEFRTVNAPLKMVLEYAYDLPQTQIAGAPSWIDSAKFDITAKSDG